MVVRIATLLLLIGLAPCASARQLSADTVTAWTVLAGATVYSAPGLSAPILAQLPDNMPLRVTMVAPFWGRIVLWNALTAYVPLNALSPRPYVRPSTSPAPSPPVVSVGPHAPMPLSARVRIREATYLRASPGFAASRLSVLHAGSTFTIDAWAIDGTGLAWYRTAGAVGAGWVYGDAVTFTDDRLAAPAPAAQLSPLRGKGMWFTYPLLVRSPATAIVRAARAAGLTHLYVEVGRSPQGFYGASGLAALLPVAHRAGIRVIAWVYPYLNASRE